MKEHVRRYPCVQRTLFADLHRSVLVDHGLDCDLCSDSGYCSQD
jgi:hypothetical protein